MGDSALLQVGKTPKTQYAARTAEAQVMKPTLQHWRGGEAGQFLGILFRSSVRAGCELASWTTTPTS
jgi:hypothetical protein